MLIVLAAGVMAAACGVGSPGPGGSGGGGGVPGNVSDVLKQSWEGYKTAFINPDGRVIDHERAELTTSEGQSYAMLRAAWLNDQDTFNRVWKFTRENLTRSEDGLFGFLWGKKDDGSYGLVDRNSATDADQDIALALLFAQRIWKDQAAGQAAQKLLAAIYTKETTVVAGTRYVVAGQWAPAITDPGPVTNPSYMSPYEYRIFARVDTAHQWNALVGSSYRVINLCSTAVLDGQKGVLPPNWCAFDRSGAIKPYPKMDKADIYGYDAMRTPWRVALDVTWNDSSEGKQVLEAFHVLRDKWNGSKKLAAEYNHDGSEATGNEDTTIYGGDLGAFVTTDKQAASDIVQTKLLNTYQTSPQPHFFDPQNYYQQNWVWFGLALSNNSLPDLTR